MIHGLCFFAEPKLVWGVRAAKETITHYPDKLIKRDFTLPDRSGTGRGSGGGMLRSTLAR